MEKQSYSAKYSLLPPPGVAPGQERVELSTTATSTPSRSSRSRHLAFIPLVALLFFLARSVKLSPASDSLLNAQLLNEAKCPAQPGPLDVGSNWDPVTDDAYGALAAKRLSKAVQIHTVSTDDLPADPADPKFDGHYDLAHFFETEYTKIYEALEHEAVNTHAHLFTWKGSNPSLKPIMLMAHTDTVPVNPATESLWTYPPFSGAISVNATKETPGTWIWGRGSSDCKNSLVGILGAVERLVSEGFQPERTILISYGFDEEIGGLRGTAHVASVIEEKYGKGGVEFLIDEGFSGIEEEYGTTFASLGMAEKGSVNFKLVVETLGGHSSVPPQHTGIGYMSLFLAALEKKPFKPTLEAASPYLKYLSCLSEHAPEYPASLRRKVQDPKAWPKLAKELAGADRRVNSFLATTTAIDLISGGVKVNALPEVVEATTNHRISFTSSVNATQDHMISILEPLAAELGFTFSAFTEGAVNKSAKHLDISTGGTYKGLEPAPITPSNSSAFAFIAGTIKTVFGKDVVVSPTGMYANTDTSRTWNLTQHIYRFTPARVDQTLNQHTVDERISLEAHLYTTRFYYKLLANTEGWSA